MSRKGFFVKRTLQTFVLLWIILTFLFFLFRFMPGSFADQMLYQGASPESVAAFEERWGLNDPLHVQYRRYLVNFAMLDPGQSLVYREPVWAYVQEKILNTFILVAPAMTVGYIAGTVLGTMMGINRDSWLDRYGVVPAITLGTTPSFFLGIVVIVIFAGWLNIFPTSGMLSPQMTSKLANAPWWRPYLTANFGMHYILPFSVIVLRYIYEPLLIMRTSIVEMSGQDFAYYHRINGLPKMRWMRHLAKHAIIPVVTFYPISMGRAISGLVLIETVFNWPGIGYALVEAVLGNDYPVVQFVFFLAAAFVIVGNYIVDIVYSIIDPRISMED